MISLLVGLLALMWIFGRRKGLAGGLVGGVIGALVAVGMVDAARTGDLTGLYGPAELAVSVVPLVAAAALLAFVVPHVVGFAALGWAVGAFVAAVAAARMGSFAYVASLTLHAFIAAALVCVTKNRLPT